MDGRPGYAPRMRSSLLRSVRALISIGLALGAASTLWNCSSDPDPLMAGGNVSDGAADPSPPLPTEAGMPDASEGLSQEAMVLSCVEANTRAFLRCNGDFANTGLGYLEASCKTTVARLFLPGTSPDLRAAQKQCDDSRGNFCSGISPACLAVRTKVGTLGDGTACEYSLQCASGVCSGASDTACGVCAAPTPVGGDCSVTLRCGPLTECDSDSAGLRTCRAMTMVEEGAECSTARPCREGNTCAFAANDGGATQSFVCKRDVPFGYPCLPALGNPTCSNPGSNVCSSGSCRARPIEGEACDATRACRTGFVCDGGMCRKGRVDVPVGSPCKANADACIAGATCTKYDPMTMVASCTAEAKLDESCGSRVAACAAPLVCDRATLVCRPPSTLRCP